MTAGANERRSPRASLGFAGRMGLGLIVTILLACVATIPWSMGRVETGATTLARYEASNLTLNLLPPIWQSLGEMDAARVAGAREAGQYIPGRVLGPQRIDEDSWRVVAVIQDKDRNALQAVLQKWRSLYKIRVTAAS